MIVDVILAILFAPIEALLLVLPSFDMPDWFAVGTYFESCGDDTLGCWAFEAGTNLPSLRYWFPITTLLGVLPIVFLAKALALGVKITRFLVSLFTGGGGAT